MDSRNYRNERHDRDDRDDRDSRDGGEERRYFRIIGSYITVKWVDPNICDWHWFKVIGYDCGLIVLRYADDPDRNRTEVSSQILAVPPEAIAIAKPGTRALPPEDK